MTWESDEYGYDCNNGNLEDILSIAVLGSRTVFWEDKATNLLHKLIYR